MPPSTWTAARPSGSGATKLFSLNNRRAICAAYAQNWLVMSLAAGRPHQQKSSILHNEGMMAKMYQQHGMGGSSANALPAVGLRIVEKNPNGKEIAGQTWADTMSKLTRKSGHYYMTMKNPMHAMACIVQGGTVYYLEPQLGLFKMHKNRLANWAEATYAGDFRIASAASRYKRYRVEQDASTLS